MRLPVRLAKPASKGWNITKTLIQSAFFWGLFLAVLPLAIQSLEQRLGIPSFQFAGQAIVGWIGFGVSSCLGLWSGITMASAGNGTPLPLDTANDLVVSGPYRFVRNPMAVAGLAQGMFVGVVLGSYGTLIYVLTGLIVWNYFVRPYEEADLAKRFNESYEDYRRQIKCWIPNLKGYRPP